MFLFWGREHVQFYNDACRPSLGGGGRHPRALGAKGHEFWTDVWDTIGPEVERVLTGGAATWHDDRLVPIERDGKLDDAYWTYGYSPVYEEDGSVAGVLVIGQETTSHLNSDAEARRLSQRLFTVLESITDAFFTLDPAWRFTFLNTEAERMLEQSRNNLLGRVLWDAFPEAVGSQFEGNYRRALSENIVVRFESYYPPLQRWFHVAAYPSDEGLAVYFHDVTDRKDMEQRLRHKEQLLEVAGKTARLGGWIYETGGEHVFWSDEVCAIHEVPAGTTPTVAEALDFYAPEWRPIIAARFAKCMEDGTPFDLDLQIVTSRGELVWVQAIGSALRDDEGMIRRVQGAFQDISARKHAETALKESESRWELLSRSLATTLDSITDGVIATDQDGSVLRMNPVAAQLTGWSIPDACGQPIEEVFCIVEENSDTTIPNPVRVTLNEGVALAVDHPALLLRTDGPGVPIAAQCAPIKDDKGVVNGAVLVLRNMTAERAAQTERGNIQKQLILADRMSSVGTLAAGIAHEINNPLSYVIANVQMVADELREMAGGSVSSRMSDLLSMTQESLDGAERIRKIVRGLKTFSRADEERLSDVQLQRVLEFSINMASNEIRHRARLVTDFKPTPAIRADEARLGQVFINLLVNAAQAFPESGKTDNEIRVATWTSNDGDAVIEITDSGTGIPAALLDRIFDPFFTTKAVGVGTGLGLSICRNIVMSMGGKIGVTSTEHVGTTVRVALPASQAAPTALRAGAAPEVRSIARRARVLIIDDEPSVSVVLQRVLRAHTVTAVTNAATALDLLRGGAIFDVILSDLMMPDVSGMDFYNCVLQTRPELAGRIVFITGGAFTALADEFLESVPNERLDKPFDIQEVKALVSKFVPAAGATE